MIYLLDYNRCFMSLSPNPVLVRHSISPFFGAACWVPTTAATVPQLPACPQPSARDTRSPALEGSEAPPRRSSVNSAAGGHRWRTNVFYKSRFRPIDMSYDRCSDRQIRGDTRRSHQIRQIDPQIDCFVLRHGRAVERTTSDRERKRQRGVDLPIDHDTYSMIDRSLIF